MHDQAEMARHRRPWTKADRAVGTPRTALLLLVFMSLAACSASPSGRQGDAPDPALLAHAGEPVRNVFIGNFIRDWQVISRNTVRMEFNRQRHFLVELGPPCSSVLGEVISLELMPNHSGYLSVFDQVQAGDMRCRIESIRELDYQAALAEQVP